MHIRVLFFVLATLFSTQLMAQKTMPNEYTFWDIKGDSIKLTDIKYKHTLTLVLYDPGCDHCWHQAKDIADDVADKAKDVAEKAEDAIDDAVCSFEDGVCEVQDEK